MLDRESTKISLFCSEQKQQRTVIPWWIFNSYDASQMYYQKNIFFLPPIHCDKRLFRYTRPLNQALLQHSSSFSLISTTVWPLYHPHIHLMHTLYSLIPRSRFQPFQYYHATMFWKELSNTKIEVALQPETHSIHLCFRILPLITNQTGIFGAQLPYIPLS